MQLPIAYLDAAAIEEISLELWNELFEVVGWPESLEPGSLDHESILASLERDEPSEGLLLALEAVHDLGSDDGREALLEAMRDRMVDKDRIPESCGEREFALRIFLIQRKEPAVADAFTRAQIKSQAIGQQKAVNEFWGVRAQAVQDLNRSKNDLVELMRVHCRANDLGEHVQVEAFDDDGSCIFRVIHSDRTREPLAIVDGSTARSRIRFRPVHCDVLRYEAASGRLQVAARRAGIVNVYPRLLGQALFEDRSFFDGEPACTLEPLQKKGRTALLGHNLAGVGRVWMTECTWRRGDRRVHRIRSVDCFEDIEALELPIGTEGELVEVKLKLQVADSGTRPATVAVRLPGRITVTPNRHEQLAHRYLEEIGVRSHRGFGPALDLWNLPPWRHAPSLWRAVLGNGVDELLAFGALESIVLDSVAHPDRGGASLEIHPTSDGEHYGVGVDVPSKSLSPTDVEGLELDIESFGAFIGARLGLPDGQVRVAEGGGVLDLGVVALGDRRLRPFYLMSTPTGGLTKRLQAVALGDSPVLLVPRGRGDVSDLPTAELLEPVPSRRAFERALVLACGLQGQVPAVHYAREDARLVVDTIHGAVWVDDVQIGGLVIDTHPFKFVEMLARAAPQRVSSADVVAEISPHREDDTTPARHAKRDAKKAIVNALAAAGKELGGDPFPSAGKGCYRCALGADVV